MHQNNNKIKNNKKNEKGKKKKSHKFKKCNLHHIACNLML